MILFITSTNELARQGLAEKIVKEQEGWKHIPYEGLQELLAQNRLQVDRADINALLAGHVLSEVQKQGFNIILTASVDAELQENLKQEGMKIVSVYMQGKESAEGEFDLVIDMSKNTLNDACEMVLEALQ